MSFCLNFPLFLIVMSLMSAVISSLLPKTAARILSLILHLTVLAANIVIAIYTVKENASFTYLMGHYPHPWGNEIRIGTIEAVFSAAFSLVMFLCLVGGKTPIMRKVDPNKVNFYYVMTDLIQAALLVLVYTNDIFTGYVFIEICTLASCGILMIRENGKTILASVRYMIFSLIGSGLFLFGVIFLYNITGELLMPSLKEQIALLWESGAYHTPLLTAFCLISIGLAIKSGLCPFHLWMADTYGAAIPASSGILSGLISKGYIFFLIKVIFDVFGTQIFYASGVNNVLFLLGAAGIVIGSLSALRENNIYRMVAYSSAAQIGYIYMGIGISPTLGITAALFHILCHAVTKPALFLSASQLSYASGDKKKFHNLQGAGLKSPFAGLVFSFEAFSMIGLPFTMGLISKYLFGMAAFENAHNKMIPALIVLAISTILNIFYFARTIIRLYNHPLSDERVNTPRKQLITFYFSGAVFMLINLFLGIFSQPFIGLIERGLKLF